MCEFEVWRPRNNCQQGRITEETEVRSSRDIHYFAPLGFENTGVFGSEAKSFITELGQRIKEETKEAKALPCLLQHLSVTIQHSNAAADGNIWCPGQR